MSVEELINRLDINIIKWQNESDELCTKYNKKFEEVWHYYRKEHLEQQAEKELYHAFYVVKNPKFRLHQLITTDIERYFNIMHECHEYARQKTIIKYNL